MPKLFLVIFIGSQVANLSDGKTRGEMSTLTKVLDVFTIVASVGLAAGTGWYVHVFCSAFPYPKRSPLNAACLRVGLYGAKRRNESDTCKAKV